MFSLSAPQTVLTYLIIGASQLTDGAYDRILLASIHVTGMIGDYSYITAEHRVISLGHNG